MARLIIKDFEKDSTKTKWIGGYNLHSDNTGWLTTVPATDINFRNHLKVATMEEIKEALSILKSNGEKGCVSKISALERELRKRERNAK